MSRRPTNLDNSIKGQEPSVLAVGAVGVVWTFFSDQSFLSSFYPSGRRLDID